MKSLSIVSSVAILVGSTFAMASTPLSESDLLALVRGGSDPSVVVRLVERGCVDFELDARATLRLSEEVPAPILHAVLDCLEERGGPVEVAPEASPIVAEVPSNSVPDKVVAIPAPVTQPDVAETPKPSGNLAEIPTGSSSAPYSLDEVRRIAILPVSTNGSSDDELTAALITALTEADSRFEIVDATELGVELSGRRLRARGLDRELLEAALSSGVDAFLMSDATAYIQMGNAQVRLQSKLIEARRGSVVWKGGTEAGASGLAWDDARAEVAQSLVRRLP